jgi:hypothetical protein
MGTFDLRDIRKGMDVYRSDGTWVGTVLEVEGTAMGSPRRPVAIYPTSSSQFDGERLGPVSTQGLGNTGPLVQYRGYDYLGGEPDAGAVGRVLIGQWFGLVGRRWIGPECVVNVSLERIVIEF